MDLSNLTKLKVENFPRRYALITVQGVDKLACRINEEWVIDSTCKSINEMLEQGVIGTEAVQGWVDMQPATSH